MQLCGKNDVAIRWRVFYFHYYLAVALEGLFSCLTSILMAAGPRGQSLGSVVDSLGDTSVATEVCRLLDMAPDSYSVDSSPSQLFATLGVHAAALDSEASDALDKAIRPSSSVAECVIETLLRKREYEHRATGPVLSLILLATALGRYKRWERTRFGDWFASVAVDRYLDLILPIVSAGLSRRFGNWWSCTWRHFAAFVLSRYVIQQHQAMSYEKTSSGERCIIQVHGDSMCATGSYDKIGIGNPRFHSAVQILTDLGLCRRDSDKDVILSEEGRTFLQSESREERGQ